MTGKRTTPAPKQGSPVSFRDAPLERELATRVEDAQTLGLVAKRDLGRFYSMLDAELRTLQFTLDEAVTICEALDRAGKAGYHLDLWAIVDLAVPDVDRQLIERLRELTPGQKLALWDASERFWRQKARGETSEGAALLVMAGALNGQRRER